MNNYLDGMRHYADFTGRATRAQFWQFGLGVLIIELIGLFFDGVTARGNFDGGGAFTLLALLVHLLPSLAITVRRLHDIDRSGAWIFVGLIPIVGPIIAIVFACTRSSPGPNQFGPPVNSDSTETVGPDSYRQPNFDSYQQVPPQAFAEPQARSHAPVRPAAVPPKPESQLIGQLERLAALRASGAIDDSEFAMMKADVLSRAS